MYTVKMGASYHANIPQVLTRSYLQQILGHLTELLHIFVSPWSDHIWGPVQSITISLKKHNFKGFT